MSILVTDHENPCCICANVLYLTKGKKATYNRFTFYSDHALTNEKIKNELKICNPCFDKHKIKKMDPNNVIELLHDEAKLKCLKKAGFC